MKIKLMTCFMVLLMGINVHASEKEMMKGSGTETMMKTDMAKTYTVDHSHSTIGFKVRHLGIGTTRGSFTDYDTTITFDPMSPEAFTADVEIQVDSINTKNQGRDDHLRSPDFFDAQQFPLITFKSTTLEKTADGYQIVGDLTIKDVTKTITLPALIAGPIKSPFGADVISIEAEGSINRKDFNVNWSKTLDNGGLVVGEKVEMIIEIEAHLKG